MEEYVGSVQMRLNKALVDADSIYFRAAMKAGKEYDLRKIIKDTMNNIRRETMCNDPLVAVKGKGNFRKDLYDAYKAHRKPLEDEIKERLAYSHNYMIEEYGAIMADDMEADDLVSIWAYECMTEDIPYVVVGIDKDLLQIPGDHYNFVKGTHQNVDRDTANYNLMLQCLTGDNADNIPGIKGIGPKKAERILKDIPDNRRWNRVLAAWRGHRAGDPRLSLRLLKMLTSWDEFKDVQKEIQDKASISK